VPRADLFLELVQARFFLTERVNCLMHLRMRRSPLPVLLLTLPWISLALLSGPSLFNGTETICAPQLLLDKLNQQSRAEHLDQKRQVLPDQSNVLFSLATGMSGITPDRDFLHFQIDGHSGIFQSNHEPPRIAHQLRASRAPPV